MNLMQYAGKYLREKDKIFIFEKTTNSQGPGPYYIPFVLDENQQRVLDLMCNKYVLPLLRADNDIEYARILFDKVNFCMKVLTRTDENEKSEKDEDGVLVNGISRCLNLSYHKNYVPEDKDGTLFREVECVDMHETYIY